MVLGDPIFSLKGNQGQGWKPASIRYIGSADSVEVRFILSVKKFFNELFIFFDIMIWPIFYNVT